MLRYFYLRFILVSSWSLSASFEMASHGSYPTLKTLQHLSAAVLSYSSSSSSLFKQPVTFTVRTSINTTTHKARGQVEGQVGATGVTASLDIQHRCLVIGGVFRLTRGEFNRVSEKKLWASTLDLDQCSSPDGLKHTDCIWLTRDKCL